MGRSKIRRPAADRRSGFTLLELLIVVAVIAILVGILMPATGGIKAKAMDRRAEAEVKSLALAIRAYHTEIGDWPIPSGVADVGGVWSNNNYVVFGMLVQQVNSRRNYLELTNTTAAIMDPYTHGMPYIVTISVPNNTVQVRSAGRDGIPNNSDDVYVNY